LVSSNVGGLSQQNVQLSVSQEGCAGAHPSAGLPGCSPAPTAEKQNKKQIF
jgi:hypothetical protein